MDFSSLNKLEFENAGHSDSQKEEGEESQDQMIEYSVKIMEALKKKVKAHNKENPKNKININQLKEVYQRGAGDCSEAKSSEKTCNQWGLARTNMFIRMKLGDKMEISKGKVSTNQLIDISEKWEPSEEDFKRANGDIEKYNLNFDFSSAEELYINIKPEKGKYGIF